METNIENRCSICIFCLKSTHNSTGDGDCATTNKRDQYKFFTLIIRHLLNFNALISADNQEWCINACKVISEITINGDDNEPFFENVQICRNCEGITQNFSDLYHQLKELELRIDWEVSRLRDVMGCADKLVSKREKDELEKTFTNGGVVTLGEFRNTLKQSCHTYQGIKKKISVPNVQLVQMIVEESPMCSRKVDVDVQDNWEFIPTLFSPIILEECASPSDHPLVQEDYPTQPEIENKRKTSQEDVEEHDEQQEMYVKYIDYPGPAVFNFENDLSPLTPSSSQPVEPQLPLILQEEDPLHPPNHSRFTEGTTNTTIKRKKGWPKGKSRKPNNLTSNLHCTPCSLSFSNQSKIFSHDMSNHPEKYFLSVKFKFLTPLQFQNIVAHMLTSTVDEFQKLNSKYQCIFCSQIISAKQYGQTHLVLKHRSVLKDKLVEMQNSTNINVIMNTSRRTNIGRRLNGRNNVKRRHNCNICGKVFEKGFKFNEHQINYHPEVFFESSNLLSSSSENHEQFKNIVRCVLEEQMQVPVPKKGNKIKCGVCSKVMCTRQSAKSHLILRHRISLAEKLKKVQQNEKSLQEIGKQGIKIKERKLSEATGSEFHATSTSIQTFECSLCSLSFKTKFGLFQHDVSHHIDKYFASAKLKFLPNEQFKKNIIDLLRLTVDGFNKINSKYQCSFCPKLLCGKPAASRIHLVKMHRPILKQQLMETQKYGHVPLSSHSDTEATTSQRMKNNYDSQPVCNICGKVYRNSYVLNSHQTFYHPEIFFENVKPIQLQLESEIDGNQLFSKYVRYMLGNQVDQEFTIIPMLTLPERDPLEEPQSSTQSEERRDNMKYKCNFCSQALCNRRIAITHLVLRHQRNMAEILGDLRGKTVKEVELEVMGFETGSSQSEGRRPGPTSIFGCSLCSKTFNAKFSLIQHELSFHIEKYFLSAKLKFISNEQFKKCIVHTLRESVDEETSSKFKCSFCAKQFSSSSMARYHLVVKHRPILKDKLVEVQKCKSSLQSISASEICLKRKGGWPKGKSRLLRNPPAIKLNFKPGIAPLKIKRRRGRGRPKGKRVIDHVPVFRRQRVAKVSRCGGCGKRFANVYTLRTHLKGYCSVLRDTVQNLEENSTELEEGERMDVSGIEDLLEIKDDE